MADTIEEIKKKVAYYERLIREVRESKKFCLPCKIEKINLSTASS
jgi:hypothetical protein